MTKLKKTTADATAMINIAKSIISGGADQQPGVTSKTFLCEIKKRADVEFAGLVLSPEQRFSRFVNTVDGETLLKASRRATQEAFDSWDDDEAENDEPNDVPMRTIKAIPNYPAPLVN